jgi:hypothetical protein
VIVNIRADSADDLLCTCWTAAEISGSLLPIDARAKEPGSGRMSAFAPIPPEAFNSGVAVSPKIPGSVTQREYLQAIFPSMDTLAEIRVALDAASQRIDSGQARPDTRRFLDDLWAHVYDTAPVDLQPYVWSRLADLGDLLGVPQAHYTTQRQPPSSHYRL